MNRRQSQWLGQCSLWLHLPGSTRDIMWGWLTGSEFWKILPKMICFVAMLVCFFNWNVCPMPVSTTSSQVLSIIWLMSCISKTLMNGLHMVDLQMMSGMTSVPFMRIFMGMLFVPQLSSSTHFVPQNKVRSSYMILTYCISSSLWYWYVIYDLWIVNKIFFLTFWYFMVQVP